MEENKSTLTLGKQVVRIPIEKIAPNPRQPRRHFDQQSLQELARSIRLHGILQPLTVQRMGSGYVLVAGERRLRAAGLAGLNHVPCRVVKASEQDSAILALVENLQRSDLHYLEEAAAISKLIGYKFIYFFSPFRHKRDNRTFVLRCGHRSQSSTRVLHRTATTPFDDCPR